MRVVLCCGGREWDNQKKVDKVLKREHKKQPIDYVIEGGQKSFPNKNYKQPFGADYQCKVAAMKLGIQVIECPANWDYYKKKAAGPIRNQKQLDAALQLADTHARNDDGELLQPIDFMVLAFHADIKNSKGTKDMVNRAKKAGVKVKVIK